MDIRPPFWSPAGVSGFILDWDGVLAETSLDFSPIREKYYGGRRAMILEEARSLEPDKRRELFRDLVELEMAGADKAKPVTGAFELLERLEAGKIPYCILSRNCMEVITHGAEVIGLELPERTWGRDNLEWVKPDPRALRAAASSMGLSAGECVYVGDFLYDLQGARRAGMRAVLVQRDERTWEPWADVIYPLMTDLVAAMDSPSALVPWEYREIHARKGARWLENAFSLTFALPSVPSPTLDCWIARAASLGVGRFSVPADARLSPDEWKMNPSFDTSYMGMPLLDVVREFLAPRFPMVSVSVDCSDALNAPKNSLDLMRYLERKKII